MDFDNSNSMSSDDDGDSDLLISYESEYVRSKIEEVEYWQTVKTMIKY